jgi:hypothetical protein
MSTVTKLALAAVLLSVRVMEGQQIASSFERVLVPLTPAAQPGANGSIWSSELWVYSDDPAPYIVGQNDRCENCADLPPTIPTGIAEALPMFATKAGEPPGSLLYVRRSAANRTWLECRIHEASRGAVLTVPVFREDDLVVGATVFPRVALRAGVRAMLRLYNVDSERHQEFDVEISDQHRTQLAHAIVPLRIVPKFVARDGFVLPVRPEAAEFSLTTDAPYEGDVTVRITPVDSTLPYAALISVTDNSTQAVDLLLPSHRGTVEQ